MSKFISGNWSYNPENYTDGQVPVSTMAQDLLTTYKLGWKTSYYQNTYDSKKDEDEPTHPIGLSMIMFLKKQRKKRMRIVTRVQFNEDGI